jgi:hypothetical protein
VTIIGYERTSITSLFSMYASCYLLFLSKKKYLLKGNRFDSSEGVKLAMIVALKGTQGARIAALFSALVLPPAKMCHTERELRQK